jgi:hypothetical protein
MAKDKFFGMNKKAILIVAFSIYFLIIILSNLRSIADEALKKNVYKGAAAKNLLSKTDHCLSAVLLFKDDKINNSCLDLFMNVAAANTTFNHFSARMNSYYKVIFKIVFNDGSEKIVLPDVGCVETGLRMNNLYSAIATADNELYRDVLMKRLAEYECSNFSNVKKIAVVLGEVIVPSPAESQAGQGFSYNSLYVYGYIKNNNDPSEKN